MENISEDAVQNEVSTLAKAEVDLNLPTANGLRPLHQAARDGSYKLSMALLKNGADPTLPNGDGQSFVDTRFSTGGRPREKGYGLKENEEK